MTNLLRNYFGYIVFLVVGMAISAILFQGVNMDICSIGTRKEGLGMGNKRVELKRECSTCNGTGTLLGGPTVFNCMICEGTGLSGTGYFIDLDDESVKTLMEEEENDLGGKSADR